MGILVATLCYYFVFIVDSEADCVEPLAINIYVYSPRRQKKEIEQIDTGQNIYNLTDTLIS